MTTDDLLTPEEVAERLRVHRATLTAWRVRGEGPTWTRLGARAVRYRLSDVEAYLREREGAKA